MTTTFLKNWSQTDPNPLSKLYYSFTLILFCGPIHKLCFRVFHIVPFTFALLAFYGLLMYLLRFSVVQHWCKLVLFAVLNNYFFQRYFRTCMRSENVLSSNKPGTSWLWFMFAASVTNLYLGQILYKPFLPVFVNALTLILILIYLNIRCSVLFELPDEPTTISWTSTLAMFSRQLGFETPLHNRLLVDEQYPYMLPRLGVLYIWKYVREAATRYWRPSSVPPTPIPPVPPEIGGSGAKAAFESASSGLIGVTGAAVLTATVTARLHQRELEHRQQQHSANQELKRAKLDIERANSKLNEINQFRALSKDQIDRIDKLELKLKHLGNPKTADEIALKSQYEDSVKECHTILKNAQDRLVFLSSQSSSSSEGISAVVQDLKPPAVYSCFEPIGWPFGIFY